MGEIKHINTVIGQMDRYLDHHNSSEPAQAHVIKVLDRFEFMVGLATQRALADLQLGQEELPADHTAVVIPFPRRPGPPPAA